MPDEPKPEGPRYQATGAFVQGPGQSVNVIGLSPDQLQVIVQAATEEAQKSHKESIAHIASELDSTREVVRTFLRIIGEPGVPPERFSEALLSAATQYRAMHDAVHGRSKDAGSTQRILDEVAGLRQKLESIASRAETNPSGVDKERGEGLVHAEQAFSRISAGVRQNQEQIEQGISQSHVVTHVNVGDGGQAMVAGQVKLREKRRREKQAKVVG